MSRPADADAAWAWVEHLRAGGTTPWREWSVGADASRTSVQAATGTRLPGAAQMELVRRLARCHAQQPAPGLDFPALADRVLARPGPGRGSPDLLLAGPDGTSVTGAGTPLRHGAPAVDPATVPAAELVRIGVGVLADLLVETPSLRPGRRTRRRSRRRSPRPRRRPFAPGFRLAGAPVSVRLLRSALVAAGRVPGGRRPTVLVLAAPFDDAVQQAWTRRVTRGSEARWSTYVRRRVNADRVPASVDPTRAARRWAERVGAARVQVVVGRHDDPAVRRTAADVLGLRVPEPVYAGPVTAAEVDLVRRLNAVLKVRLRRRRHRAVLRRGLPGLFAHPPHPPLALPPEAEAWADRHSARVVEALSSAGYAVHGDLAEAASLRTDTVDGPLPGRVLDATLVACLRAAGRHQDRDGGRNGS